MGGDESDTGLGLALSSADQVFLTGYTESPDFPTANAIDNTCGPGSCLDTFVAQLDIASNILVYSTYLGGEGEEGGTGITVDGTGSAYITGCTQSSDFPVVDAKGARWVGRPTLHRWISVFWLDYLIKPRRWCLSCQVSGLCKIVDTQSSP